MSTLKDKIKKGDKVRFFHSLHKTALESKVKYVHEGIVYIERPPNFKGGNKVILRKPEDVELVNE